ncbi:hypothetical protein D8682_11195 [Buttiauxella sp. 3AFRM03]|uniref:hypothetical protein n=1 Tax=unclassified Buttiauxella TaxID=2634062 RepID=UPI000EF7869C|nr:MULTISPECIES: hypothetical protein [unclassified Buttiauxella]AYN27492.1 hypothetical protein D8682_11195 [Buttiauxella sp. 3AFRM03]
MITATVKKYISNPSAKLIIVSYSPTGGGHTARLLNIISMALEKKSIPEDSIVMFHVPCPWEGTPRSPLVANLAKTLINRQINVWIAESDKSIYGYLNKETGGSDDASILQHITRFPQRNVTPQSARKDDSQKTITELTQCVSFQTDEDCKNLPIISAKNLMNSMAATFGREIMAERCYVLTDMDPYLQKAAQAAGVPGKRCLDQQNHAILLNLNDSQLNILPKYALLSKVLGGYGEQISHIDLGGRNTLVSISNITERLGILSGTPKYIARLKIADLLLSHALPAEKIKEKLADANRPFSGVMAGSLVQHGGDAQNIVYVYAHKKTNIVARCVNERMCANDPLFQSIIFLFCGPGAAGDFNAMHLAYIADADGITTAGAGTIGEFAYLRKQAGCGSRLLVLPIEGHNEQEKNADVISEDNEIKAFVVRTLATEQLSDSLLRFVSDQPKTREAPCTMNEFITAISDQNSYVRQAYDRLFNNDIAINFKNIEQVEQIMNRSPLLKATRKYLKLVFQALNATEKEANSSIQVMLQQGMSHTFSNVKELNNTLLSSMRLAQMIGLKEAEDADRLPLLSEVRRHFSALAGGGKPSVSQSTKLKEEFGEFMVTGF